jgi:hypothetical protein
MPSSRASLAAVPLPANRREQACSDVMLEIIRVQMYSDAKPYVKQNAIRECLTNGWQI